MKEATLEHAIPHIGRRILYIAIFCFQSNTILYLIEIPPLPAPTETHTLPFFFNAEEWTCHMARPSLQTFHSAKW